MFYEKLSKKFYQCVHQGRYTVSELAELTGIPASTIYRSAMGFVENASGMPPNVRTFLEIQKAQGNWKPLKFVCNWHGFLFVRLPRVARDRKSPLEKIRHLQEHYLVVIQYLLDYDRHPTRERLNNASKALYLSIEAESAILRDLRYNFHQLELPLVFKD